MNQEWENIRTRLLTLPSHFHSTKTVELLDLCIDSDKLKLLEPSISLGRLRLSLTDWNNNSCSEYGCFYFYNGKYVVSNYDNTQKYFFEKDIDAIVFFENRMPLG